MKSIKSLLEARPIFFGSISILILLTFSLGGIGTYALIDNNSADQDTLEDLVEKNEEFEDRTIVGEKNLEEGGSKTIPTKKESDGATIMPTEVENTATPKPTVLKPSPTPKPVIPTPTKVSNPIYVSDVVSGFSFSYYASMGTAKGTSNPYGGDDISFSGSTMIIYVNPAPMGITNEDEFIEEYIIKSKNGLSVPVTIFRNNDSQKYSIIVSTKSNENTLLIIDRFDKSQLSGKKSQLNYIIRTMTF
jgi:hypothetical protein